MLLHFLRLCLLKCSTVLQFQTFLVVSFNLTLTAVTLILLHTFVSIKSEHIHSTNNYPWRRSLTRIKTVKLCRMPTVPWDFVAYFQKVCTWTQHRITAFTFNRFLVTDKSPACWKLVLCSCWIKVVTGILLKTIQVFSNLVCCINCLSVLTLLSSQL